MLLLERIDDFFLFVTELRKTLHVLPSDEALWTAVIALI
jgi:hypothetical protein